MQENLYKEYLQQYNGKKQQLAGRLSVLSILRLALFLAFIYFAYRATQTGSTFVIVSMLVALASFFILVKWYDRLQQQMSFYKALVKYNEEELLFLQTNQSPYDNGASYEDAHHPYSYDLDIFGKGGLYGYLNRCSTEFGKKNLSDTLLNPNINAIHERQQAVQELSDKTEFRQQLYAYGSLQQNKEKDLKQLMAWINAPKAGLSKPVYFSLLIFPLLEISSLLYYLAINDSDPVFTICYSLFFLNLIIAFSFSKKIASQLSVSTAVTKILRAFRNQLLLIEQQNFSSTLLKKKQEALKQGAETASGRIKELASLFEYLESVVNLVVSILLNGLFLFHVHILYRLGKWQQRHAASIPDWLEVIGEVEALNSLANFSYNNPEYCFPEISDSPDLQATALAHPLIKKDKRIANDVSFHDQKFVILTGSNMSGKSTFLRTVGMNLMLAKTGAPVTAKQYIFYPFDIYVSMRITDSLQENESFFYAELKRLHTIIEHLKSGKKTFVILDEILRGTNSNDKRNGTIGLIHKMAGFNTFGMIATHDVMVADLIKEYPSYIANKAFESQIVNDELLFDYKLKEGVCTTLSASYLMKKMGVID